MTDVVQNNAINMLRQPRGSCYSKKGGIMHEKDDDIRFQNEGQVKKAF
jgi:hypothetical protein